MWTGRRRQAAKAAGSLPGACAKTVNACPTAESLASLSPGLDGPGGRLGGADVEDVGADPAHHQPPEASGIGGGHPEQKAWRRARTRWHRPGRWPAGRLHVLLQVGVCGGVVRFFGLAVTKQIDADYGMPFFLEDVDPARFTPVALERRREAVNQQHRKIGHRSRLAGTPSPGRTRDNRPLATGAGTGYWQARLTRRSTSVDPWPAASRSS